MGLVLVLEQSAIPPRLVQYRRRRGFGVFTHAKPRQVDYRISKSKPAPNLEPTTRLGMSG